MVWEIGPLTAEQDRILDEIWDDIGKNGWPPGTREPEFATPRNEGDVDETVEQPDLGGTVDVNTDGSVPGSPSWETRSEDPWA